MHLNLLAAKYACKESNDGCRQGNYNQACSGFAAFQAMLTRDTWRSACSSLSCLASSCSCASAKRLVSRDTSFWVSAVVWSAFTREAVSLVSSASALCTCNPSVHIHARTRNPCMQNATTPENPIAHLSTLRNQGSSQCCQTKHPMLG